MALFVIGAFLLMMGSVTGDETLSRWGGDCIFFGVVLQAMYLVLKHGKDYID